MLPGQYPHLSDIAKMPDTEWAQAADFCTSTPTLFTWTPVRLLVCLISPVLLGGCTHAFSGFFPSEEAAPEVKMLGVVYHASAIAEEGKPQPLPGYHGTWTRDRMARDLQRLADCGVSLIGIAADPVKDPRAREFAERLALFGQLAGGHGMKLFLYLVKHPADNGDDAPSRRDQEFFADWLTDVVERDRIPMLESQERMVCVVGPGLAPWRARRPNLLFLVPSPGETPSLPFPAADDGTHRWIFPSAPDASGNPRARVREFADNLNLSAEKEAGIVCVDAWNNYADGRFVEPNTLDGNLLMDAMAKWSEKKVLRDPVQPQ